MRTTPLTPGFGLELHDVDLREVTADHLFPEIRRAFETHSLLLIRDQSLDPATHTRIGELFGPLENREAMASGADVDFEVSSLSNRTSKGLRASDDMRLLDLQANMLWHTDSTFLPTPSLVNIITADVVPDSGGQTEIASTRLAWAEMPEELKAPLQDAILWQPPVPFARPHLGQAGRPAPHDPLAGPPLARDLAEPCDWRRGAADRLARLCRRRHGARRRPGA